MSSFVAVLKSDSPGEMLTARAARSLAGSPGPRPSRDRRYTPGSRAVPPLNMAVPVTGWNSGTTFWVFPSGEVTVYVSLSVKVRSLSENLSGSPGTTDGRGVDRDPVYAMARWRRGANSPLSGKSDHAVPASTAKTSTRPVPTL